MTELERTLPGRLLAHARERPREAALREKLLGIWSPVSWADYATRVADTARALARCGVVEGDHVGILSDNRPEWLYADLGAQALGARSVGIYQTNPPEDVAYILNHAGCKVLVCEDQEQVDKAIAVADDTPSVTHVVVIDPRGTRDYEDPRLVSWEAFMEGREEAGALDWLEERCRALDPAAPSMVIYTSGTTGDPKGAMISSANALATAREMLEYLSLEEDDQLLSYLPLCHVAEKIFSLFIPLAAGATVHFGESIETVRGDLREVSPTVFLGVPRIWEKMHASVTLKMQDSSWLKRTLFDFFSARGREIARRRREGTATALDAVVWQLGDWAVFRPLQERLGLRRCELPISGAAPIGAELLEWFHGVGIPICEGYGMTESAGASNINVPGRVKIGTVGPAIPGTELRIAEDGEILMRGPHVFCGYLHNPDATAETIDDEGWLHTGDVGEVDDDGYLKITGRKKEIIITAAGKNLSPEKIENALKASPLIKEAVAIGDRRKFVSALIQIEYDAVADWATRRGITHTSFEDLASKPEVRELVDKEVRKTNERLARVENVRAFRLFPKELHQDDGELTATQKVRRRAVMEKYSDLVESIYTKGGGS